MFIHEWSEPYCLYSQAQGIIALWPVLISRLTEGRRLSWPGWLVTYYNTNCSRTIVAKVNRKEAGFEHQSAWYARPKTVTHPCTDGAGSNLRPQSGKSDALTTTLPSHHVPVIATVAALVVYLLQSGVPEAKSSVLDDSCVAC